MTVKVTKPALNIREKLAELDKPTGLAGEAILRTDSVQDIRDLLRVDSRNLLINSCFRVHTYPVSTWSQRNMVNGDVQVNRWRSRLSGSGKINRTLNEASGRPVGSDNHALRIQKTSTSGYAYVSQTIESKEILKGKTIIMSATVKTDNSDCKVWFMDGETTTSFNIPNTGNEWERVSFSYTVPETAWLSYFSIGFAGDRTSASSVAVHGSYTSGSNIYILEPQVEIGNAASDFERRFVTEEELLCARYHQRINLKEYYEFYYTAAWAESTATIYLPVEMRSTPSAEWGFTSVDDMQPGGATATAGNVWTDVRSVRMQLNHAAAPSYQDMGITTVSGTPAGHLYAQTYIFLESEM